MQLTKELQENIANSAHDMKSPACALSLAVDSLLSSFYGKCRIDKDGCEKTMVTLKGMMQSVSALNMIINRSVVRHAVLIFVCSLSLLFLSMIFSFFFSPLCCFLCPPLTFVGCHEQNVGQFFETEYDLD